MTATSIFSVVSMVLVVVSMVLVVVSMVLVVVSMVSVVSSSSGKGRSRSEKKIQSNEVECTGKPRIYLCTCIKDCLNKINY